MANLRTRIVLLSACLTVPVQVTLADDRGWVLNIEYHLDSRAFNSLQFFNTWDLLHGISLVNSLDLNSPTGDPHRRWELQEYFLESDLNIPVNQSWGGIAELNNFNGPDNDIGRFGLFIMPQWESLKHHQLWLYSKIMPIETDGHGGQLSIAFSKRFPNLLSNRFSISGYLDWNYATGHSDAETKAVSDVQFRYLLQGDWYLFTEWHYNQFKPRRYRDGGRRCQIQFLITSLETS